MWKRLLLIVIITLGVVVLLITFEMESIERRKKEELVYERLERKEIIEGLTPEEVAEFTRLKRRREERAEERRNSVASSHSAAWMIPLMMHTTMWNPSPCRSYYSRRCCY